MRSNLKTPITFKFPLHEAIFAPWRQLEFSEAGEKRHQQATLGLLVRANEGVTVTGSIAGNTIYRVLFENRPALHFCYYIFITAHKLYNFGFRIKDTV